MSGIQFDDTLGALLVGFSFSCVVFGVLSMQCFWYFQRYHLDRPVYKGLVAGIWFLELVDQALIGHVVYFYTITNYAQPFKILLGDITMSLILQILVGATVGTFVKCCFAMRVWRFSNRNRPITGFLMILIFGQYGLAIYYAVKAFQYNKFQYAEKLKLVATLALGSGAVTDILTAATLVYFLKKFRTGYKHSDSLVTSLIRYALSTGALTSAISISTLVLYNVNPKNFVFVGMYFVLSKLYANSFLSTLNTRRMVRGKGTDREAIPGESGNTSRTVGANVRVFGGQSFYMYSAGGGQYRSPTTGSQPFSPGSPPPTKSLEIGVHQEISVVSDVDEDAESPTKSPRSPVPEGIRYHYDPYGARRF